MSQERLPFPASEAFDRYRQLGKELAECRRLAGDAPAPGEDVILAERSKLYKELTEQERTYLDAACERAAEDALFGGVLSAIRKAVESDRLRVLHCVSGRGVGSMYLAIQRPGDSKEAALDVFATITNLGVL